MPPDRPAARARGLLPQLTLSEKAGLLSGDTVWTTKAVARLGVPALWLADGPHGVRKARGANDLGVGGSLPATCFPTLSALACSWDPELVRRVGAAIGREARVLGVDVVLGPGLNIVRSPLGGRTFEYFSEDPLLSGELAAAFVAGVQAEGVGACVKHFAVNNQETARMRISAELDERTLREIYLPAFEIAVTRARPWTVMCAYNRVNGTFASEHRELLHEILRDEWGFDGIVMSDWGAVNDRVAGVRAGLHLEMPSSGGVGDRLVMEAVRAGSLDPARLDEVVGQFLRFALQAEAARGPAPPVDADLHHALAREAAARSVVLLKNEGALLPLEPGQARRVAVIGRFAKEPRFQGGGSSQVTPTRVDTAWEELGRVLDGACRLDYAEGYGPAHEADPAALAEARRVAAGADLALIFVGLPAAFEVEGVDRTHLDLPPSHDALVEAVAEVQPNLAVVLVCGAPVRLPWVARAPALVLAGLGGQAAGGGLADVLTGRVNPGGKLAVSYPHRLEDCASYLNFPGDGDVVRHGEGVFVGYRWHDTIDHPPLFAFGHGLSYTRFALSDLRTSAPGIHDRQSVTVSCRVRNAGGRAGCETVQLYVRPAPAGVRRPRQELRAFAKVSLAEGEEATVPFELDRRAFAHWDARAHDWAVASGSYEIALGTSSRDLRLATRIEVEATAVPRPPFDRHTPLSHWLDEPAAREALLPALGGLGKLLDGNPAAATGEPQSRSPLAAMLRDLPVGKLVAFTRGAFSPEALARAIAAANGNGRG